MYTDQELRVLCSMIKKTEVELAMATEDVERGGRRRMIRTRGPRPERHGKVAGSSSGTSSSTSSGGRKRKRSGSGVGGHVVGDPLPSADVSGVQRVKKHKSSATKSRTTAVRKVIG